MNIPMNLPNDHHNVSIQASGDEGFGPGEQKWGYVDVRPGAHMFWWLYYTTNANVSNYYDKPLLIWLQGGPGVSSGIGNFLEFGPIDIHQKPRNHTWVKDYNILFIDNPVGTGFSYVDHERDLTRTNTEISRDLMQFIREFMAKFPEFLRVPTYITSQSYGGKMAIEWAFEWYKAEQARDLHSNLTGVFLGNPWISPNDSVMTWAPYLFHTGMIDKDTFKEIEALAEIVKESVNDGAWLLSWILEQYMQNIIHEVTHGINFYNILTKIRIKAKREFKKLNFEARKNYSELYNQVKNQFKGNSLKIGHDAVALPASGDFDDDDTVLKILMNNEVKKALNISRHWDISNEDVSNALAGDFMKPVTHIVEELLNKTNLRIVIYSGQLDLVVDTPGTVEWVQRLNWKYAKEWDRSIRYPLVINGTIEGFYKSHKNLDFYWVNRAGHDVPKDNPVAMAAILERGTKGQF
ncbi:hypothetical protein QAD02_009327 [Eretmocerus hayati]|uniref:Uncharacterized protein n=1 Tax=Eretmocerus hayati TaxID=131215 RepID=A0ACC2N9E1_9HYME|nr:hypothetical protein QAD02_009327 [Eretmocerus hayati]